VIIDQCPHCQVRHVEVAERQHDHWGYNPDGTASYYLIGHCNNPKCGKKVFLLSRSRMSGNTTGKDIFFMYPCYKGHLPDDPKLPEQVQEEFSEAAECSQIGAYLSSMTMSRRVLQRCLKAQGCEQRLLAQQIDAAKSDEIIPKRYHLLADEIREYGNIGAHPDDDKVELATSENAHQLLEFIQILIEEFYVLPAKADALLTKRQGT